MWVDRGWHLVAICLVPLQRRRRLCPPIVYILSTGYVKLSCMQYMCLCVSIGITWYDLMLCKYEGIHGCDLSALEPWVAHLERFYRCQMSAIGTNANKAVTYGLKQQNTCRKVDITQIDDMTHRTISPIFLCLSLQIKCRADVCLQLHGNWIQERDIRSANWINCSVGKI